jgi:hypothetical protein
MIVAHKIYKNSLYSSVIYFEAVANSKTNIEK